MNDPPAPLLSGDDVATTSLTEAMDAYECLWGSVAALAARTRSSRAAGLQPFLAAVERASRTAGGLARAESDFLEQVAAGCGNRVLAGEALELRALAERELGDASRSSRDLVLAVHRRLVRAIDASDPGRARDAVRRHAWLVRHELGLLGRGSSPAPSASSSYAGRHGQAARHG